MKFKVFDNKPLLSHDAATQAIKIIQQEIQKEGEIYLVLATGTSQFDVLSQLVQAPIDWSRVTMFHLDEYIGVSMDHPASFRKYLKHRFVDKVKGLKAHHFIQGDVSDPQQECRRLNQLISSRPVSLALVGIGENGHLAFNDPPADFDTEDPFLVVELDLACRQQQMREGWFKSIDEVPKTAISMSIHQIMQARHIICAVPDQRKAPAVRDCFSGVVSNQHPASVLQQHSDCLVYLDQDSATLLKTEEIDRFS